MKLKENTKFLFLAISSRQNESQNDIDRFSQDIFHVVHVLEKKGVDRTNIEIVSDWNDKNWINHNLDGINLIAPQDAYEYIRNVNCENLFIIVSCHGGLDGIGENGLIKPHDLLWAIKNNAILQNCVAILGQCHAGVFHYSNVADQNKNIVYIGATGLRFGVSAALNYKSPPDVDITWSANVLVYWFAQWIENPKDVDNDGEFSIMDMYKYVTHYTNLVTKHVEKLKTMQYLATKVKIEYKKQQNNGILDPNSQLEETANNELLDFVFLHQECWILNAIPASSMIIKF